MFGTRRASSLGLDISGAGRPNAIAALPILTAASMRISFAFRGFNASLVCRVVCTQTALELTV